jgi:hypothetical protein
MRRGKPDCPGMSPTAPRNLAQLRAPKVGRPILQRFPKAFSRGSSRATGREGSPSTALECTPCRARGAARGKGPSEPGTVALRRSVEFGREGALVSLLAHALRCAAEGPEFTLASSPALFLSARGKNRRSGDVRVRFGPRLALEGAFCLSLARGRGKEEAALVWGTSWVGLWSTEGVALSLPRAHGGVFASRPVNPGPRCPRRPGCSIGFRGRSRSECRG